MLTLPQECTAIISPPISPRAKPCIFSLGARTAREVIGYLFGPPAWRPDKPGAIATPPADAVTHSG